MRVGIIDLETTGLLFHPDTKAHLQPRCIEFGAVVINEKGEQLETMSQLVYPEQKIDPIITKITGLTNDDLAGQPLFEEVADDISKLISSCNAIVAHNLPFDSGVLNREFELIEFDHNWPHNMICTVQENVPIYGYRIKLKDLFREVIGQPWTQNHRALDDCKALAEIVVHEGYLELLK